MVKEKKGKLHRKKELAMLALLQKPTIAEAAKSVGVGEATLYNWLRDEDFQKSYRALKQDIVGHSVTRLQKASSLAVDALVEIVQDKDKPSSVRVMSARSILDFSNKGIEVEHLEESILSLERLLNSRR
jgi:transposase-like protein